MTEGAPQRALGPIGEALIVAKDEVLAMLLGLRAIVFAVVYGGLVFGIGAGHERLIVKQIPGLSAENLQQKLEENRAFLQAAIEQSPDLIEKLGGRTVIDALLAGRLPFVLFIVLLISSYAIPLLVLMIGYDRIAEDLSSRYARFVLQRVRRGSFLAGKLIGHWGAALATMIFVHVLLLAVAAFTGALPISGILAALPRVWLAASVIVFGYAAFTACASAWIAPPFAALAVGFAGLVALWVSSFFRVGALWMGNWIVRTWVLEPIAVLVVLGNAALFTGLAYLRLRVRDV